MKEAFMSILQLIVKGMYAIIKAAKRVGRFFVEIFSKTDRKKAGYSSKRSTAKRSMLVQKATSETSAAGITSKTRYTPKKKIWWKDKWIISGAAALIIACAIVLAITLPKKQR